MGKIKHVLGMDCAGNNRFARMKERRKETGCAYEKCVACGATTNVPVDTPISERKCYVPGAGQLCRKCCIELYGTDDLRSLQSAELEQMFL